MANSVLNLSESSNVQLKMGIALLGAWTAGVLWIVNSVSGAEKTSSIKIDAVKVEVAGVARISEANKIQLEALNRLFTVTIETLNRDISQSQEFSRNQLEFVRHNVQQLESRIQSLENKNKQDRQE